MLYNQNWDKPEVKADPFSLESLISWLEKQPGDATYNWHDCHGACLLGIYFRDVGVKWGAAQYIKFLNHHTRVEIAGTRPFAFGAALTRARAALAA